MSEQNDLVEEMARVAWNAKDASPSGGYGDWNQGGCASKEVERIGIRAVLAHLARRGVEGALGMSEPWPTYRAIERVLVATAHLLDRHNCDCHGYEEAIEASRVLRARLVAIAQLAPLLAARDAALEERDAEIERLRARAERAEAVAASEQRMGIDARLRAEAAEKRLKAVMAISVEDLEKACRDEPFYSLIRKNATIIVELIRSRAGTQEDPPISDPAERAKAVAKELRGRGILSWAVVDKHDVHPTWRGLVQLPHMPGRDNHVNLDDQRFATIGPLAIADEIQREEAARAKKWGGDE